MRRSALLIVTLGVALGVTAPSGARAAPLFNNLAQQAYGGDQISNNVYASFSVGSQGLSLSSMSFALLATSPLDGLSFRAILRGDNSDNPGSVVHPLGQILDSALLGASLSTPSIITLTESTPIALTANARYWIELTPVAGGTSANWLWTNTANGAGVGAEFTLNGAAGNYITANNTVSAVYMMEISAVPEPDSTGVLGVGIAGLVSLAYLRRRSIPTA